MDEAGIKNKVHEVQNGRKHGFTDKLDKEVRSQVPTMYKLSEWRFGVKGPSFFS